jgi:exopolysaccharide production protein ExoZ
LPFSEIIKLSVQLKLGSVQYLRAIAVLMVVAFHAQENMGMMRTQSSLMSYGQHGVDLFFVISGFIITVTTASQPSSAIFLWKRVIRIVPLYWAVTLAYATVELLKPGLLRSASGDLHHFVSSLLFIPAYHPRFPKEIWPTVIQGWSLNYEMTFYAIFAIALFITPKWRGLLSITVLSLFIGIGQVTSTTNPVALTFTSTLLLEFSFGIVAGEVFLRSNARDTLRLACSFFAIALVSLICELRGVIVWQSVLLGSISGCALSTLLYFEQTGSRFDKMIPIKIGDASYSIYLTHFAVIGALRMIGERSTPNVGQAWALAWQLSAVVCACLLGFLVHLWLEKPLTKKLTSALNSARARQVSA